MVIAEIPLWVIHSNDAAAVAPVIGKSNETTTAAGASSDHNNIDRAQGSLSLLDGTGSSKKCAIYSVDMHPSGKKFATGGGDGTVRLWSTLALFSKHRSKFQEGGEYASSESSSAEDGGGGEDNHNDDEDDVDVDIRDDKEAMVHDLNSLVRRKKDGSTVSTPVRAETSPERTTKPSPSRPKQQYTSHRLLCTLSAHTGSSVLAVRFSTTGRYMASAGDDAAVCIYAPSSTSLTGNLGAGDHSTTVEHWSRIKLCRGHTLDVVGLAWAPDDSHLVSCSLDSDAPIIVWKVTDLATDQRRTQANVLCNPYKILGKDVHTSTVKGVTFDPAGTYLASSGDDPAVCIWRAHDDWGLERKVDASSGIFRKWKEDDAQSLSSQTLFRRLSWSTDGSYICSTNAVVKNKHVASTISRDGWSVSNAKSAASGAANLVGHKQPVVVSRHAAQLLDARKSKEGTKGDHNDQDNGDDDDDLEPDYATLLALGDKCGFVTVWSTRKSRPLFKLQCSESRCTVTDLAWGKCQDGLVLLVSLLDGHLVALRFGLPNELGPLLSDKDQARVFQLRYGIDVDDDGGLGRRRLFVGESSGPKLIENALQLSLEERANESVDGDDGHHDLSVASEDDDDDKALQESLSPTKVRAQQKESQVNGKKRIRPILLNADQNPKRQKVPPNGTTAGKGKKEKKKPESLKDALDLAAKATSAAENVSKADRKVRHEVSVDSSTKHQDQSHHHHHNHVGAAGHKEAPRGVTVAQHVEARLPHSTEKVHTVDLPLVRSSSLNTLADERCVADCRNGTARDSQLSAVLSISLGGRLTWKDEIVGTSCCAIAATGRMLAVGTTDGCVMLYGTSPTLGWRCGVGFRSHAPLVFGHSIVSLQLGEKPTTGIDTSKVQTHMVVVTSDGAFGAYELFPNLQLSYKGTVLPPMSHMTLSSTSPGQSLLPKLSRIQITESGHLMLLLAHQSGDEHSHRNGAKASSNAGVGGSLQAFVYSQSLELWTRMADGRFSLSDFYTVLPSASATAASVGVLAQMEHAVRAGSTTSSSSSQQPFRNRSVDGSSAMYHPSQNNDSTFHVVTRSHCEDRMACALALGSASEFQHWLGLYARTLTKGGCDVHLRLLVDMLLLQQPHPPLHSEVAAASTTTSGSDAFLDSSPNGWWLSTAPRVLNLDRKWLIQTIIIPEMSKNRALQRITNEIDMELKFN